MLNGMSFSLSSWRKEVLWFDCRLGRQEQICCLGSNALCKCIWLFYELNICYSLDNTHIMCPFFPHFPFCSCWLRTWKMKLLRRFKFPIARKSSTLGQDHCCCVMQMASHCLMCSRSGLWPLSRSPRSSTWCGVLTPATSLCSQNTVSD